MALRFREWVCQLPYWHSCQHPSQILWRMHILFQPDKINKRNPTFSSWPSSVSAHPCDSYKMQPRTIGPNNSDDEMQLRAPGPRQHCRHVARGITDRLRHDLPLLLAAASFASSLAAKQKQITSINTRCDLRANISENMSACTPKCVCVCGVI